MELIPTEYQVTYRNRHVGYVTRVVVTDKWRVWGDADHLFDTPEEAAEALLRKDGKVNKK